MTDQKARPFLKWAGGKRGLLEQLRPLLPAKFGDYHEPFVGGGAMFFDLGLGPGQRAYLSDANEELVRTYLSIRDTPRLLICHLRKLQVNEEEFYRLRQQDPSQLSEVECAARMIYLNKTCFNGLYRVNGSGKFNVSWGKCEPDKVVCDGENIRACSAALERVTIKAADFLDATACAKDGDFVYLDPPYVPVSKTANFTGYTADRFGKMDLGRLAEACRALASKGALFMLSNADTPEVRKAFEGFQIDVVQARRAINCDGARRGRAGEVVVRNYS